MRADDIATRLVVGVTSHRDLRPEAVPRLRARVSSLLGDLFGAYRRLRPVILSPLAEGGDRLVAEVGLDLGAELVVPLPFDAAAYRDDFADDASRVQFDALLSRAARVAPIAAGAHAAAARHGPDRDRQYLQTGLYVANHCHVLLALWDGAPDGGTGGTAQIVRYHLGGTLPGARRARDNLRTVLAGDDDSLVLHLPIERRASGGAGEAVEPRWLTCSAAQPVADGLPAEFAAIFARMDAFEGDRRHLPADSGASAPDPITRLMRQADALALRQQRRMLGAVRGIHGLALLMGLAFLLYSDLGAPDWMLWLFLLFFALGLATAWRARRRDWHRRYVDYRALAEGLRVQAFWRRAGLSAIGAPEFAHDNFLQKQDVELAWIRNVMRQAELLAPPIEGDPPALDDVVEEWVGRPGDGGQLGYYDRKSAEHARHHLRTRAIGLACLWAGIALSVVLVLFHRTLEGFTQDVLVTLMGAFSLVAAIREAYAYRKADRELVRQYRFMHRIYRNARAALDAAGSDAERAEILRALGEAALAEHAEWTLMHRERTVEHGRP
jgi:hypothetical protein